MGDWLRFYPDYSASPGLWLMDENGRERGLMSFDDELPPELHNRIERWITEWEQFHDCDLPDNSHGDWSTEGHALLLEIRRCLEPLGWRVEPDFDDTEKVGGLSGRDL